MEHPDMIEETPPAAPRRRGRQRIHPPKPPNDPSAAPRRPLRRVARCWDRNGNAASRSCWLHCLHWPLRVIRT